MEHKTYIYRYERQMLYKYLLTKYNWEQIINHQELLIKIFDKMLPETNEPMPNAIKVNKIIKSLD